MQRNTTLPLKGISVIIPFFKAEQYFAEALESAKAQSTSPNEIIVVNDGGGSSVDLFLQQFDGITIINLPENMGPSKARNIGIEAAKFEWITMLDADDRWEKDKLEKQLTFLAQHPEFSACHTGLKTFNGEEIIDIYNDKPFKLSLEEALTSSHVLPTSFMLKKEAFTAINGFDSSIKCSEDDDLIIRLVSNGFEVGFLAEPLAFLRREGHGNISSNGRKILVGHFQLLKKHWALYKNISGTRSWFIYKTFMSCGGKSSGLEKKVYYLIGKIIKILFKIDK